MWSSNCHSRSPSAASAWRLLNKTLLCRPSFSGATSTINYQNMPMGSPWQRHMSCLYTIQTLALRAQSHCWCALLSSTQPSIGDGAVWIICVRTATSDSCNSCCLERVAKSCWVTSPCCKCALAHRLYHLQFQRLKRHHHRTYRIRKTSRFSPRLLDAVC